MRVRIVYICVSMGACVLACHTYVLGCVCVLAWCICIGMFVCVLGLCNVYVCYDVYVC